MKVFYKFRTIIFYLAIFLNFSSAAHELGIFIPGISYHLTEGIENAPRAIDKKGVFVLNPGIGIEYDFRSKTRESALSVATAFVMFKDCQDRSTYVAGIGPKYRYHISESFSFEGSIYLASYTAQNWEDKKYHSAILPFPSIGVNYHAGSYTFGIKTTISPSNSETSSISDKLGVLLGYLYLGYSF
jgi:hypothetical protein